MARKLIILLVLLSLAVGSCGRFSGPESETDGQPAPLPGQAEIVQETAEHLPEASPKTIETVTVPAPAAASPGAAVQALAANMDAYPPSQPFSIQFGQPVDPASADPALLSYPWVDGELTWSEDYTRLTFSPVEAFEAGREYQLFLNSSLKTALGEPVSSQEWRLNTLNAPRLVSRAPGSSQLSTRLPVIRLEFDQEMDRASVQAAFSVSPEVLWRMTWESGRQVVIEFNEALDPGSRYHFTLAGDLTDARGVSMGSTERWSYWLDDWTVDLNGPNFSDRSRRLTMSFSYHVDQGSVDDSLRIDPPLQAEINWIGDKSFYLETDESLPANQLYTFSFEGDIYDKDGQVLPPLDPVSFQTPPPILAVRPIQGGTAINENTIQIRFDRPMDERSTEAAFSIDPDVSGVFSWSETTLYFRPSGYIVPFAEYTVTLSTDALDADGNPILVEPFQWSFESADDSHTRRRASFGDAGPNAQVMDANGRRAVQFVTSGVEAVNFELYRLNLEQFLDRYSSNFRGVAGQEKKEISIEDAVLTSWWELDASQPGAGWSENIYETLVPGSAPAGLYVLNMLVDDQTNDQLLLVITGNSLLVKEAGGQLVVWASEISGGSAAFLEIGVYARDGSLVASGTTDGNGLFETEIEGDPKPLIVVGRRGSDITVSGLSFEWTSGMSLWGWWIPTPEPTQHRVYLYTDRPIYRPGQSVYYKAVLRNDDDNTYSLPAPGTSMTLRVRDARNNIVQTFELETNSFGTASGEFILSDGAMLGDYRLEVEVEGERTDQVFKVQDYRKPDYQVSLSSGFSNYVAGDAVDFVMKAEYYFGEPVANAQVEIRRFYLEPYSYWWDAGAGSENEYHWYEYQENVIRGRTDENGLFTFNLTAELSPVMYYDPLTSGIQTTPWGIEATVDDGSNQAVSGTALIKVYSAAEKIELDIGSYLKQPGQPFTVHARMLDLDDTPVGGRQLSLELRRWSPSTFSYTQVVQSDEMEIGPSGEARQPFTIEQPGYYEFRATSIDARGNDVAASRWVYAFSGSVGGWYGSNRGDLRISTELSSYQPGQTANLIIESSFSGSALLTFERGRVHREMLIELTSPITLVPVVIQPDDAPNIFVAVNAWKAQDTELQDEVYTSLSDSRLFSASVDVPVQVMDKRLNVTITPDRDSYAPRQQAELTIQVTDEGGSPVRAEVSLAMVDEAIYALSEDLAKTPFDAFFASRRNLVNTYNSMAPYRSLYMGGIGGGGGDEYASAPRTDFRDTAAWFPVLHTDENGIVIVTVELPDNLTNWRLTARAVTADTQVGMSVTNIITHQETIVRPVFPRVLVDGDLVNLRAAVHNYAPEARQLYVSLAGDPEFPGLVHFLDPVTQSVQLEAGAVGMVSWRVEATGSGEVRLTVGAFDAERAGDAVRLPLPVKPRAAARTGSVAGIVDGEMYASIFLPEEALETSKVEVEISRSIAGPMLDGLEYLTGYPFGCVEQTMSRALPNAVVGRAFNQLGIENPTLQADLPKMINAGLQRLYGYQHNDGGWGWWYDDDSHDYQTAWVVFGLAVTAEAGYEVDPGVIERGVQWLRANLDKMDLRTKAYALYSMAAAGYGSLEETRQLAERSYELDTFSQAALALALHAMGEDAPAYQALEILEDTVVSKAERSYWPQAREDGYYYQKTMASTTRSSALALQALVKIHPDSELISGATSWLMSQRRQQGWGSTNETSFAIMALTETLLPIGAGRDESAGSLELNGRQIWGGTAGEAVQTTISKADLQPGINLLRVEQIGSGRLYARVRWQIDIPQETFEAAGNVRLQREYLSLNNRPIDTAAAGEIVKVNLTINADEPFFFAILEDRLPGGLEALNESLNTTSHTGSTHEEAFTWRRHGYNNKEVYGDRVILFFSELPAGATTVSYLARVTQSGVFTALPAEIWAMYDETVLGRSSSSIFLAE
jgi:alpha-2-macroglobulin